MNVVPSVDRVPSIGALERALKRERAAREQSDALLETRSRELYLSNQELEKQHGALKDAQAQLVQSEKLASVGQLAAGVAHEINNPIGFVMSNLGSLGKYTELFCTLIRLYQCYANSNDTTVLAEIVALEQTEDIEFVMEDVVALLSESTEGIVRVKDIVQGLKSFSRIDDAGTTDSDIHQGIEDTLKLIANELKYKCEIVRRFGELPLVPCNLAQVNQVFMNLLVNASQAIQANGRIEITTSVVDSCACIEIRDTGCGIDQDKLDKIFDPFFTTKPVGEGTGLGLAISYGIIEEHGGRIEVESALNEGTAFTIQLPLVPPV